MSISIKTPEDIAGLRIAGRLAAELLDYLTPFVNPAFPRANSIVLLTSQGGRILFVDTSAADVKSLLRKRSAPAAAGLTSAGWAAR